MSLEHILELEAQLDGLRDDEQELRARLLACLVRAEIPEAVALILPAPDWLDEYIDLEPDAGWLEFMDRSPEIQIEEFWDLNVVGVLLWNRTVLKDDATLAIVRSACAGAGRVDDLQAFTVGLSEVLPELDYGDALLLIAARDFTTQSEYDRVRDAMIGSDQGEIDAEISNQHYRERLLSQAEFFFPLASSVQPLTGKASVGMTDAKSSANQSEALQLRAERERILCRIIDVGVDLRECASLVLAAAVIERHPSAASLMVGRTSAHHASSGVALEVRGEAGVVLESYCELDGAFGCVWIRPDPTLEELYRELSDVVFEDSGTFAAALSPLTQLGEPILRVREIPLDECVIRDRAAGYKTPTGAGSSVWGRAVSIAQLGELTARWLEQDLKWHPAYLGSPDPETWPIVPVLAQLNRAGLVTLGSQPGQFVYKIGNCQRSFVDGVASTECIESLTEMCARTGVGLIVGSFENQNPTRVAVTMTAGLTTTWSGIVPVEELEVFRRGVSEEAMTALTNSRPFVLFESEWGEGPAFWEALSNWAQATSPAAGTGLTVIGSD